MKRNVYYKSGGEPRKLPIKIALIMKLTGIMLLAACMQVSAAAYSQKITLSEKNSSLEKVFRKIMKQSDYMFLYNNELLEKAKSVSIDVSSESIENVLHACFSGQPVTYAIFDKTVVVKPRAVTNMNVAPLPPVRITGKVLDNTNLPLPGVSVVLKGANVTAVTNANGVFVITVPEESLAGGTLVFSSIGFQKQEVLIGGKLEFNIKLAPEVQALNEVVVVGYGTQRRGDVSQAISSVNMENLREVPVTNITQALQGRVPGLVSTPNNFRPGTSSAVVLRGSRSLKAGNEPLYVVDGIPITYSIDDVNPLDIESIDVLKDAAATAIYGSRGANGVIQVTTKKGKAGKITIDYNGTTSVDNIVKKLEVYDGAEFAQFRRDAFIGTGTGDYVVGTSKRYFPDPAADFALFTSNDNVLWNNVKNAYEFTELDIASTPKKFVAKTRPTTASEQALLKSLGYPVLTEVAIYDPSKITTYNWGDDALQTGLTQNHNISISGGSDKFRSSFGGGYYNQTGIVKSQGFSRFTLSNNNNFRPKDFLNFGTNISYSNSIQNFGTDLYGAASGQFPLATPYDANGKFLLNPGADDQIFNPLNDEKTVLDERRVNRLLANAFGQVDIIKGLSYRIALGVDLNSLRRGRFNGSVSSVQKLAAPNANYDIRTGLVWTLQNQLSYSTVIAQKHSISATVVQELRKSRQEDNNTSATELTYESQKWYALQNNAKGTVVDVGTFAQEQLASHIGRLNYSYDGKYIVTAGLRHDASSVLTPENNSQVFPFGSIAWRLDQEPFIKKITAIDQLKIRAGYGAVGNSGIGPYLTAGVLDQNPAYYNFGDVVSLGYTPSRLRSLVTWERTVTKNLGIDYGFLNNRLSGSIDVYESNTNSIQDITLPGATGIKNALVNLGNVKNRGLEITLSTVNFDRSSKKNGFKWTSDIVFSTNKEQITDLNARGSDDIAQQFFYGQPIKTYWDFKSNGIFQYTDTLPGGILKDYYWKKPANKASDLFRPGKIRVEDVSGDTIITDADRIQIGSPNPKWTASLNNTFSFKGFDLSSFIYISQGSTVRDFRPGLVGRYPGPKVDYWTPTNPSNNYQQPNRTSDIPLYWQSLSFRDGSFVRVRSILLAYHVPASLLNKINVSNMTVSINAVNPFLFSKYDRYDPETVPYNSTYPQGSTSNPAPSSYSYRSFVLGLRMGL